MTLRRANLFVLIAAFLALSIRVLVPTGFMPGNVDGRLVLDICTGAGPVQMDMGGKGETAPAKAGEACSFAGGAAPALLADVLLFAALAILFVALLYLQPRVATAVAPSTRRPPQRGPPLV